MLPEQCRAARGLLGWSQSDLAKSASVHLNTVSDFERGTREPRAENLDAMRTSLIKAGIVFIERNGGGPGVRLKR
jgi:transcriptional regulator with XRE-family HTH domain